MSIVDIRTAPKGKTRHAVCYVLYGKPYTTERERHQQDQTTRAAASRGDMGDSEQFVRYCETLAKNGRSVEALTIIHSYNLEDLSPENRGDVERAADTSYELMKRAYPDSVAMVYAHVDSEGGKLHTHCFVANDADGKSIQKNRKHSQLARINDKLMEERGFTVTERNYEKSQRTYWAERRGDQETLDFDIELTDKIFDALEDPEVLDMDSYKARLAQDGIEVVQTNKKPLKPGQPVPWKYRMPNPNKIDKKTGKPKLDGQAAGKLNPALKHAEVEKYLELKRKQREKPAAEKKKEATDASIDTNTQVARQREQQRLVQQQQREEQIRGDLGDEFNDLDELLNGTVDEESSNRLNRDFGVREEGSESDPSVAQRSGGHQGTTVQAGQVATESVDGREKSAEGSTVGERAGQTQPEDRTASSESVEPRRKTEEELRREAHRRRLNSVIARADSLKKSEDRGYGLGD